ncbi:MAG: AmiS/UreI transporter [Arthrobacter sp.]|nr:AmiS/UreI transporter [Arthrobacter sp.]
MTHVCLLLSGAALLINGLAALNVVPTRDAAVFSLVIGSTHLILGVTYLAAAGITAGTAGAGAAGPQVLLSASGI